MYCPYGTQEDFMEAMCLKILRSRKIFKHIASEKSLSRPFRDVI
jgi:hypothetical protein